MWAGRAASCQSLVPLFPTLLIVYKLQHSGAQNYVCSYIACHHLHRKEVHGDVVWACGAEVGQKMWYPHKLGAAPGLQADLNQAPKRRRLVRAYVVAGYQTLYLPRII